MMSVPRPVGAAFAVARSLASRCCMSAVVWMVWAWREGAAMRARDRMMLRGILTPWDGWSDCTGGLRGVRVGRREQPHVSDDETVANMGHPARNTHSGDETVCMGIYEGNRSVSQGFLL